jgi:hypothetical protein
VAGIFSGESAPARKAIAGGMVTTHLGGRDMFKATATIVAVASPARPAAATADQPQRLYVAQA